LLRAVADSIGARFNPCTLRGEISGYSRAGSGHHYFNLKDADGSSEMLRCAMFRRAASLIDFTPAEGQRVEVRGRVDVYPARGELQLIVESMQREGAGALYEQFLRLKARLEAEGLFDPGRRRALPRHPRAVGVVTSLAAAALHDVITTLARRAPQIGVVVYPSKVQGSEAPAELVAAIRLAGQRSEVDTLIVCRGGGSLEDLWAFNDEHVVRAVAASPIPVVCGVGHESDVTLCDLVADLRAATPTAAAELSVAARDETVAALAVFAQSLKRATESRLTSAVQRVDRLAAQLGRPVERLARESMRLQMLAHRLPVSVETALQHGDVAVRRLASRLLHGMELGRTRRRYGLEQLSTRLSACDPRQVISRGYALVQLADGELVVSPAQLKVGLDLSLTLAQGQATIGIVPQGTK
jgi:exodeoxyribonuclease VII large subunit